MGYQVGEKAAHPKKQRQRVGMVVVGLWCLVLAAGLVGTPARAQEEYAERCFPETGFCISGAIRAYWERNGGLPVFGYPITTVRLETVEEWSGPVQWFERDRLEDHGTDGVIAGRLGAAVLELQGRPWFLFPPVSDAPEEVCRFFPETRHSLCPPFLSYWRENGGVERFGYPITEAFGERVSDRWSGSVQYFERRRMEWHTELEGNPVLPGLLGREVLHLRGAE